MIKLDHIHQDLTQKCPFCKVQKIAHYHPDIRNPKESTIMAFIDKFTKLFYDTQKIRN